MCKIPLQSWQSEKQLLHYLLGVSLKYFEGHATLHSLFSKKNPFLHTKHVVAFPKHISHALSQGLHVEAVLSYHC